MERRGLLVILMVLINTHFTAADTVTLSTDLGDVQGLVLRSDEGNNFWAFRGIPYARPPINTLRFKPPEPVEAWMTLDATDDAADCIQINFFASATNPPMEGHEDCLFLNVYSPPMNNDTSLLPVMVYIHGGGFLSGAGSFKLYGPHRLMDRGVVLVTLNYRLGPFGFLSTADRFARGNYGLMDQRLAMEWIQNHISSFGGDPNRVTLFGQSAGAVSVSLHMMSPQTEGLFHAAILQSGNAFCDWGLEVGDPLPSAMELGTLVQCPTISTEQLVECLRNLPALEVLSASLQMFISNSQSNKNIFIFRPVVDQFIVPVIPNLQPSFHQIPTLTGITAHEGLHFSFILAPTFGGIENMSSEILPQLLKIVTSSLPQSTANDPAFVDRMCTAYFQDVDESDWSQRLAAISKFISSHSDAVTDAFHFEMVKFGLPVYVYKLSYRGSQSLVESCSDYHKVPINATSDLVGHGDELQYLFRCSYFRSLQLSETDTHFAKIILNVWTNFAKTHKPSLSVDGSQEPISWTTMETNNPTYINMHLEPKVIYGYLNEKRQLWDGLLNIRKYNVKIEL